MLPARLALPLALAAMVAAAPVASAHICVAFLVSIFGPHIHVLC